MSRFLRFLWLGAAAVMICGCAGYRLGPIPGAAAGKSIQVSPFSNQTLEPRLTDAVTTALRKTIQRDGTCKLATDGSGQILLTGVITSYTRHELSFLPNDVLTVSDYRVNIVAHVTAREASSGKVILDQPVSGYTLVRVGTDLTSAERQAIPLLAEELAKNVTSLLVEGSW